MSKIVDTEFGRFRQVDDGSAGKAWLFECPKCGSHGRMTNDQMSGKVSVVCSGPGGHGGCNYHETHEYGKSLVASIQSMILLDEKPYHDEGEDRWGNPI